MTTGSVISFFQPGTQPGLKASAQASGGANPFAALLASTGTGETPLATAADSLAEGQAEGRIDARFGTAGNAAMDPAGPVGARAADLPAPLHTLKALGEALGEFEDAPDFDDLPADLQHLVQQFDALPADMRAQLQGLIGDDALAGLASLGPVPGLTAAGEQATPHSRPAAATPPPDSPALPQASASPRPGAWQHPMPNGGTEQANALAQGATNATPLAGAAANANAADMQATAASPALPAAPTPQGDLAEARARGVNAADTSANTTNGTRGAGTIGAAANGQTGQGARETLGAGTAATAPPMMNAPAPGDAAAPPASTPTAPLTAPLTARAQHAAQMPEAPGTTAQATAQASPAAVQHSARAGMALQARPTEAQRANMAAAGAADAASDPLVPGTTPPGAQAIAATAATGEATQAGASATAASAQSDNAAETPASEVTRTARPQIGAGNQAGDSAEAAHQQTSAQASADTREASPLAQAIRAAVSARAAAEQAPIDLASIDGLPGSSAQGDTIVLSAGRADAASSGAPTRSVTIPAYGSSLPTAQLAMAISSQARAGTRHFDIRLDPPEMGRIDVRLEMGRDGTLNAHLSVDRPETFDALNRDARQLERMLQQSGMKLDGSSIQFSLRDGGAGGGQERGGGQDNAPLASAHRIDEDIPNPAPVYARVPSSALLDMEV